MGVIEITSIFMFIWRPYIRIKMLESPWTDHNENNYVFSACVAIRLVLVFLLQNTWEMMTQSKHGTESLQRDESIQLGNDVEPYG